MNDWHFSRPELATKLLKIFDVGITSNIALIAPRRKGKTLFLLSDLAPQAESCGYLPIYASLWQNMESPHDGLIDALEEAVRSISNQSVLKRLFDAKIKKATVSNELLGKMDVEFSSAPQKAPPDDLMLLDRLIGELVSLAKNKTVLLMVDEIQHLSTSASFDPLAHALRTSLDKRQGRVKTVFTGSSRHYMNLLLNESKSPFYHFVDQVPFADLEAGFINFLRKKLHNEYSLSFAISALHQAFEDFDHSPYWMMKMISYLVTFENRLKEAVSYTMILMEASEGFSELAKTMKSIDIIVYKALCENKSPFSEDILSRVANETELKGIASNVQRSINRLKNSNIISQTVSRSYRVEKPGLRKFLENT
ncbi:MAG: hypothetical protein ACI84K_002003 [Pseudohongiellaceae bacterium]|jgi:hypothetical protein